MGAKTHKLPWKKIQILALTSPQKSVLCKNGKSVFSVQTAEQPDLNSVSVCSSYYLLRADGANCLRSYLDAHTKGNPQSNKMDNQLWKRRNVCFTSCIINKYKLVFPPQWNHWVISLGGKNKEKKTCCHGYWQLLSFSSLFSSHSISISLRPHS